MVGRVWWLLFPFRRGFRLLSFGLIATGVSLLFSFTPLHVELARWFGQDTEQYYPQLLWLVLILPLSVLTVMAGGVGAWLMHADRKRI